MMSNILLHSRSDAYPAVFLFCSSYLTDLKSFSLLSLSLLAPEGSIVFQVPGGERGWQDVWTAVRHIGGLSYRVVEDERAVKRCLVLTRL